MSDSSVSGRKVSKGKNRLINMSLLFGSTVVCLLIVEFSLRLIAPHELYSSLIPSQEIEKKYEEAGFFPGIDSLAQFSVNEFGYRSESYFDSDSYGILAIGGSTTYCIGLSDEEAWPWALEGLLKDKEINTEFTVGNVGVPAFNSGNHLHQLDRLEPQYENVRMALMLVGVNDFARVLFLDEEYFPTSEDEHLYNRTFVRLPRKGKPHWYQRTELYMHVRDIYHAYQSTKSQRYTPDRLTRLLESYMAATKTDSLPTSLMTEALLDYEKNLTDIAQLARERNIKLVWITQPVLWFEGMGEFEERISSMGAPVIDGVAYSPKALAGGMAAFNQKLIEVAVKEDVKLIDLAKKLPQDTTVFFDWCHYNKRGTSMIANILFDELKPLILTDSGLVHSESSRDPTFEMNDQP